MPKLTKRFVDALRPVMRDTLHRDADLPGFALRIKPSGVRTWVVQYRNSAGRTRKLALGRVGVLTPEEARQRARKTLSDVAAGGDPSASRNAARGAMTVAALCGDYLADAQKGLVLGKRKRPKSETTLRTDRGRIECHIVPQLGALPVKDVQTGRHPEVHACCPDRQDGSGGEDQVGAYRPCDGWTRHCRADCRPFGWNI